MSPRQSPKAPNSSAGPSTRLAPVGEPARSLVLATDLDGTFLGGNAADRSALYAFIRANRDLVTLIFVTGRDIPFVRELIEAGEVPRPDHIIGDVGTTIVDGTNFEPHESVQDWVASCWGEASERVRRMLADEPGLKRQPTPMARRASYYYDPTRLSSDVITRLETAGFSVILSGGIYFDVMPLGVSKGPSLERLVAALDLDAASVLVAGDTLNDRTLYDTPYAGVVVGRAEVGLTNATRGNPRVHHAIAAGAGGIIEGLRAHSFLR